MDEERIAARVVEALEKDESIHVREKPLWAAVSDGVLTIGGEVVDIASKRRAVARAAGHVATRCVLDRVRVAPATPMEDGTLRDHVRDVLLGESAFDECTLVVAHDGREETARDAGPEARGSIRLRVEAGAVDFGGFVPTLAHRRLAETLAWWVPGTCDVRNDLGVSPPEEDSDDEISDAVRFALEKEPFLDAGQLRVDTRCGEVTLWGTLPSDEQRVIAERDAWCVPGVREVVDRIELASGA
jgi:osmotically-inducible protein OsmY